MQILYIDKVFYKTPNICRYGDVKSWMVVPTLAPVSPQLHMVQKPKVSLITENDWGTAGVNITQKGNFYKAELQF